MGEMHEMYGQHESGEFNPFDGEPDDLDADECVEPVDHALVAADLKCVNCGVQLTNHHYPYLFCSAICKQEAEVVRYIRATTADGRILDPEVAEAIKIRMGMVLGGGYPERDRRLAPEVRTAVMASTGGRCAVCGADATQIHHINEDAALVARDINALENLEPICDPCHREKTLSTFVLLEPEQEARLQELRARIDSPTSLRDCDDSANWKMQWRTCATERSTQVKAARKRNS